MTSHVDQADRITNTFVPTAAIRHAVKGREANILNALGIKCGPKTKHIRCPYPDHKDNHPSWRWDYEKRRARCTCSRSNSIFDVICKVKGVDFEGAKIVAAEYIGRPDLIHRTRRKKNRGERAQRPGSNSATPQHPVGCTLAAYADAKGLSADVLGSFGVSEMYYWGHPAVRIPYHNTEGEEVAIRFRIALDGRDKFRWRKGDKAQLYGLNRVAAAREQGEIAMVEGESDCHTLWHAGFPAIGLPGAGNWNEDRDAAIFDGFKTIFVVVEPDKGGDTVRKWLARSKIHDRVKLVRLNGFKDPSSLYLDDTGLFVERWRATLDAAVAWQDETERELDEARKAAWSACGELARCTDILSEMVQLARSHGFVGEERILKLIYLAATSRVLRRIVSLAVKGPSSGGKSYSVETVLRFFPPESFRVLTAMSDRALAYGEQSLAHKMIVLYEAAGLTGDFGTYLEQNSGQFHA